MWERRFFFHFTDAFQGESDGQSHGYYGDYEDHLHKFHGFEREEGEKEKVVFG